MLKSKEFLDKEFYAFCQQEHDKARNYLKNCGKPKDWYDRWLISFNKETVSLFKGFL